MSAAPVRIAISPYARRLARERGVRLDRLRGSGPSGRIVATDVVRLVPAPEAQPAAPMPVAAFGASLALGALQQVLAGFAAAGIVFELEDLLLRAVGSTLDDVPAVTDIDGAPVALELGRRQIVLPGIRRQSLAPLRQRRLAAGDADESASPAALTLRLIAARAIRPVLLPLLPGRAMRLTLILDAVAGSAEALLSFNADAVAEDDAAEWLSRFKAYVEQPMRLLA